MKTNFIILSIISFSLFSQSCRKENCDGFDKQLELTKLNMFANDTAQYFSNTPNLYFGINFFIYDEYKTSDGNRNCNQKDLAIKYMNQWDENSISFKCNKTLYSGSKTFLANTELKDANITRLKFEKSVTGGISSASIDIIGIDNIFSSDDYVFSLNINTTDNKTFTAQETVYIKK